MLLQAKHLIPAVNGLHWRNSREIHELLNDNKDFCIYYHDGKKVQYTFCVFFSTFFC